MNRLSSPLRSLPALCLGVALAAFAGHALAGKRMASTGPGIQPEVLYHNYCSVCHGDRGDGNSRASSSFNPPPKDLTKIDLPRDYMIAIVRDGKAGTAMAGWGTQLSEKEIVAVVDYVRKTFMPISTDPVIQRGKQVYLERCASCHGDRGQGVLLAQSGMTRPPRDLSSPQARAELTREQLVEVISNGRSGTAMISYRSQLPKKDIEAVARYIDAALMVPQSQISGTMAHGGRQSTPGALPQQPSRADMSLPLPSGLKGDARAGREFYMNNCATCHGEKGDGKGPRAYFINPKPVSFLTDKSRMTLNRPVLFTFISAGKLGTEMPAWRHVLTDQEIANVAEFVFGAYIQPSKAAAKSR